MKKTELEKLTPDQVLELINSQEKTIKDLSSKSDEKDALIVELNTKLTAAETASGKPKSLTVKVGKKTYAVKSGAHLDRAYTAQEIAENEKVAGEILKLDGQTILIEED